MRTGLKTSVIEWMRTKGRGLPWRRLPQAEQPQHRLRRQIRRSQHQPISQQHHADGRNGRPPDRYSAGTHGKSVSPQQPYVACAISPMTGKLPVNVRRAGKQFMPAIADIGFPCIERQSTCSSTCPYQSPVMQTSMSSLRAGIERVCEAGLLASLQKGFPIPPLTNSRNSWGSLQGASPTCSTACCSTASACRRA